MGIRLPARTTTKYFSGDDPESLATVANVRDATARARYGWSSIAASDGFLFTGPVGRFRPNAFGLYDMHGNTHEWRQDGYDPAFDKGSPDLDPLGPVHAADRVIRGGDWMCDGKPTRSAFRGRKVPTARDGVEASVLPGHSNREGAQAPGTP